MGLAKLLVFAGLAMIVYTGYQAMSYREHLRLTQQEFEGLPLPLVLQLTAAVVLSALAGLQLSGPFKPFRVADAPRLLVMRPHRTDFAVFNHRGAMLAHLPQIKQLPALRQAG